MPDENRPVEIELGGKSGGPPGESRDIVSVARRVGFEEIIDGIAGIVLRQGRHRFAPEIGRAAEAAMQEDHRLRPAAPFRVVDAGAIDLDKRHSDPDF